MIQFLAKNLDGNIHVIWLGYLTYPFWNCVTDLWQTRKNIKYLHFLGRKYITHICKLRSLTNTKLVFAFFWVGNTFKKQNNLGSSSTKQILVAPK
jgi:hypothetical protein